MIPDYRLEILPCDYHTFPCGSFVCDHSSMERYYVGNKHSGGLNTYPVFCGNCIEHLVSHLPAELTPDGVAVEARLRSELEEQYGAAFKEQMAQAEARLRQEITEKLVAQFTKPETSDIPPVVEAKVDETDKQIVYRCLDCGSEFDTADKLAEHKQTHDVTGEVAPKRGRKKQ